LRAFKNDSDPNPSWEIFIKNNFMQDWVVKINKDYMVNPLFEDEDGINRNHCLPQSSTQMLECITNINARIIARGNRMRQALIDKKANPITDCINESKNEVAPKTVEDYLYLFFNDPEFQPKH
jgi:hypothetical protein